MARQINKVVLQGRLVKDPEIKNIGETTIGNFVLASNRGKNKNGEEVADFIRCKCFGKLASEIVGKYAHKGDLVVLEGRIQTGSYENQEGKKVSTFDVVVEGFSLCGGKKDNSSNNDDTAPTQAEDVMQGFEDVDANNIDDDEVPF